MDGAFNASSWPVIVGGLSLAALVGAGFAMLVRAWVSRSVAVAMRRLVEQTHSLTEGRGPQPAKSPTEASHRSSTFHQLAAELESSVEELRAERDRLGTIVNSMSEAVVAIDREQRITLANQAALDLLRLTEDPRGKSWPEIIPSPELQAMVDQAAEAPTSAEVDLPGTLRRVLWRAAPVQSTGGVVLVMLDVTDMRRLERMRRDFVANVSHELRTPVTVIGANAETLLDGALDDPTRARDFVDAIMRNAERLTRLVSDLLDLSRIEAGQVRLKLRALSLEESVRRALEGLGSVIAQKAHRVRCESLADVWVQADSAALDQVLVNLLDNAFKYTPDGGTVEILTMRQGPRVRIEIRDDGPGIPEKHHARIFERFYRVDRGRSRDMGGTGLGLAIVKHLIDSMRGEVGVANASPRGAVFWFSLPLGREATQDRPTPRSHTSAVA